MLDAVGGHAPKDEAELAAYACAVAIHCDRGDYELAREVGESARLEGGSNVYLLRALGRAYMGLFGETGEEFLREEAQRCFNLAGLEEAVGPPA